MAQYCFDGTMTGLLSCVFRAFEFKEFDVKVTPIRKHKMAYSMILFMWLRMKVMGSGSGKAKTESIIQQFKSLLLCFSF
jgi:hypothetical protein